MRAAVIAASLGAAYAAVPADIVPTLPGFGTPVSNLYSGILPGGPGKHTHVR